MFCGWLLLMIYQSKDVCLFGDSAQVQKYLKVTFWIKQSQATNKVKRSCASGQKHDTKKKIMSIFKDPN